MTSDIVTTDISDGVVTATIRRPAKHNAIDLAVADGLCQAVRTFGADPAMRVMAIRSEGPYFSAGADLHSPLFPDPGLPGAAAFRRWYREGRGSLHPLFDAIEAVEKPVVVVHQGPCLGGGLELSLACDFRIAGRSALYGLPEIALGGLPGSGGISRLTRIVGPHWARWLVIANMQMTAEQALAAGLVHEVHDDDLLDGAATRFCRHLAALPPEAVAAGKLTIELATDLDRAQGRNVERLAVGSLVMGPEYREHVASIRARLSSRNAEDGLNRITRSPGHDAS
ncbi:enoyl-CoA hydratase/isomerase family protein [uncultured Tistrella sp.]|uniref:enoyl-CoA hydratase/isomerase family protein n=1 Tax=Tistrella mobilis TaxID=171437 RepID=UPI000C0AABF8|nr:enoyl-CoA hydratase/isomerase family protein [uncultured Tistrella sp.]MAM73833.1 acyl-CoA hydratase [Tistrella sp.]